MDTLKTASRKFPKEVGVRTALGVELQRHGEEEEAEAILNPLLEGQGDNIQAASALVKIAIRRGAIGTARSIIRQAEGFAPVTLRSLVLCVKADVDVAEGHPEVAIARLAKASDPDPLICVATLEALSSAVEGYGSGSEPVRKARAFRVPERYEHNARVQIAQARLALALNDRAMWDRALDMLSRTRIDPTDVGRLEDEWPH